MLHGRSAGVICLAAISIVPVMITGCTSKEEKLRTEMRRKLGQMPERYKNDGAPEVGDTAHLFKLKTIDGERTVALSSFANKKPVVLFFGSYT